MAITHQVQTTITDGALRITTLAEQVVQAAVMIEETIVSPSTDKLVTVMIPVSQLKTFYLASDQDVTVETNNSSAPQETFNLKANKPVVWFTGMSAAPIAGNVTALYITNSSGATATVKLLAGWDPTL